MKLPKKVCIMGICHKVTVKTVKGSFSEYDSDLREIFIDPEIKAANVEEEIRSCVLHEILHGCLDIGGLTNLLTEEMEEAVVRCIENGLGGLIYFRFEY